jgi:hypothetical protein
MARPKSPKNTLVKETITSGSFPSSPETSVGLAEAPLASPRTESQKAENRKPAGKPEIVKNDTRANLVPISIEEEVRRLAYLLAERRGFEPGHEAEDWLAAEREIRQRYRQQSA